MTSRSSKNLYKKLALTISLITFLIAVLLSGEAVAANNSFKSSNPILPAAEPQHSVADSTLQEEPSRLELFYIDAPQLRIMERAIYVYLPPDYFTSDNSYPVIYFHDGNMVFSTNGAHDSHYDRVLDHLFKTGETEGIIAVGIDSSDNRWDEYSPWVNENMDIWGGHNSNQVEGGEGDAYLDFIIGTLKPVIDTRYRTLPDRENTAIGGFSMGGLISIYAGLKYPDVFSKVMAQSTAVWFAEADRAWLSNNQLIRHIEQQRVPDNVKFYLDIGTNEWPDEPMPLTDASGNPLTYPFVWKNGTDAAFNALATHGVPQENLFLLVEEGAGHLPSAWHGRFMDAMLWLWDGPIVIEEPELVTVVPPVIVDILPTAADTEQSVLAHTQTVMPEIVEGEPEDEHEIELFPILLLVSGIGLVICSLLLIIWLIRSKGVGKG